MAMALPSQRQNPLPPLSMNTPPPMDVASLVSDNNGLSYPTPSSATNLRPNMNLTPTTVSEPASVSTIQDGKQYSLDIVQQPVRARMCGFGDKDRRPITSPPCIRLIVTDVETNKELEINEIDTAYFVLTVDLWSADASKEVNLVRHSATSPSISATTAASYPPPNEIPEQPALTPIYTSAPMQQYQQMQQMQVPTPYSQPTAFPQISAPYHQHQYPQQVFPPPPIPTTQQPQQGGFWFNNTTGPMTPTGQLGQGPLMSPSALSTQSCDPRAHPSGMFTRNLIGSLCVSAFKLTDPENNMGVWFILQDLSVRTEGSFRLKMNFVNVGDPNTAQTLATASAPVLASCFSDVFHVHSAKKFPGVIESTLLSKCFATQGIKIPIRKDTVRGNERKPAAAAAEEDD